MNVGCLPEDLGPREKQTGEFPDPVGHFVLESGLTVGWWQWREVKIDMTIRFLQSIANLH